MHIPSLPTRRKAPDRLWARVVLHRESVFRTFAVLATALAGNAHAQTQLQALGGGGGGVFQSSCAAPALLTGIEVRSGDYVDALRPLCVNSSAPSELIVPSDDAWQGGFGGGVRRVVCPASAPIVWSMYVGVDPGEGVVNDLLLYCNGVTGASAGVSARLRPGEAYATHDDVQACGRGQLAVGLHGRSGKYIDAVGLICDVPRVAGASTTTVTSLGKISSGQATPKPAGWTICDSARDARARNSPAAPNLEAQCRASNPPVSSIGKVKAPTSPAPPGENAPSAPAPLPSPSPPAPPAKQETRDELLKVLMGSVVTLIEETRESRNRAQDDTNDHRRGSNDQRREPVPGATPATTGADHDASADEFIPSDGSIRVEVRYPAAYGYREAMGLVDPVPNSCGAFYISSFPVSDVRTRDPTRIDTLSATRASDGAYVCEYMIYNQPIGAPVLVRVAMSDQRAAGSETWLGGSQPQPPPGQRRTIVDGTRQVVLTAERPRALLRFEMAYLGTQ